MLGQVLDAIPDVQLGAVGRADPYDVQCLVGIRVDQLERPVAQRDDVPLLGDTVVDRPQPNGRSVRRARILDICVHLQARVGQHIRPIGLQVGLPFLSRGIVINPDVGAVGRARILDIHGLLGVRIEQLVRAVRVRDNRKSLAGVVEVAPKLYVSAVGRSAACDIHHQVVVDIGELIRAIAVVGDLPLLGGDVDILPDVYIGTGRRAIALVFQGCTAVRVDQVVGPVAVGDDLPLLGDSCHIVPDLQHRARRVAVPGIVHHPIGVGVNQRIHGTVLHGGRADRAVELHGRNVSVAAVRGHVAQVLKLRRVSDADGGVAFGRCGVDGIQRHSIAEVRLVRTLEITAHHPGALPEACGKPDGADSVSAVQIGTHPGSVRILCIEERIPVMVENVLERVARIVIRTERADFRLRDQLIDARRGRCAYLGGIRARFNRVGGRDHIVVGRPVRDRLVRPEVRRDSRNLSVWAAAGRGAADRVLGRSEGRIPGELHAPVEAKCVHDPRDIDLILDIITRRGSRIHDGPERIVCGTVRQGEGGAGRLIDERVLAGRRLLWLPELVGAVHVGLLHEIAVHHRDQLSAVVVGNLEVAACGGNELELLAGLVGVGRQRYRSILRGAAHRQDLAADAGINLVVLTGLNAELHRRKGDLFPRLVVVRVGQRVKRQVVGTDRRRPGESGPVLVPPVLGVEQNGRGHAVPGARAVVVIDKVLAADIVADRFAVGADDKHTVRAKIGRVIHVGGSPYHGAVFGFDLRPCQAGVAPIGRISCRFEVSDRAIRVANHLVSHDIIAVPHLGDDRHARAPVVVQGDVIAAGAPGDAVRRGDMRNGLVVAGIALIREEADQRPIIEQQVRLPDIVAAAPRLGERGTHV